MVSINGQQQNSSELICKVLTLNRRLQGHIYVQTPKYKIQIKIKICLIEDVNSLVGAKYWLRSQ